MNTLAMPTVQSTNPLRSLWTAWLSIRRREVMLLLGVSLLFGAIDLSDLLRFDAGDKFWPVVLHHLITSVAAAVVIGLCWLPADRCQAGEKRRITWLVLAMLLGSTLAAFTIWELTISLPWPSITELAMGKSGKPMPALGPVLLMAWTLQVLLPLSLAIIAIELLRRQRRSTQALQAMLNEQAELRRRAMAARLATLQAQVEPQLLFDALVAIEQAYDRRDTAAAARLDRLIQHLRVALPRLRELGTTLDAEAELLDSYLSVLHDLQPQAPQLERAWEPALAQTSLPPMLLLPLVQRALRQAAGAAPTRCRLSAERAPDGLRIGLFFDRTELCG
ncbi:MAG TPA: histidine kinase, partial [Burkholderiaceae bacterium]